MFYLRELGQMDIKAQCLSNIKNKNSSKLFLDKNLRFLRFKKLRLCLVELLAFVGKMHTSL